MYLPVFLILTAVILLLIAGVSWLLYRARLNRQVDAKDLLKIKKHRSREGPS
ncbi:MULTISPECIES: hypothetical protein [Bacillaceae]|jgi:hypothetical protein|uniref:Uncharacterized protein n=1 Tax=Alkalicoccus luteus TaxID=1237094 RepID=A0A969PYV0_9BACI|nr:hypothetical protein [Alkalicoccus luteus]NJP38072.1 hypothetical protein [Alkalicoccus luteus]